MKKLILSILLCLGFSSFAFARTYHPEKDLVPGEMSCKDLQSFVAAVAEYAQNGGDILTLTPSDKFGPAAVAKFNELIKALNQYNLSQGQDTTAWNEATKACFE